MWCEDFCEESNVVTLQISGGTKYTDKRQMYKGFDMPLTAQTSQRGTSKHRYTTETESRPSTRQKVSGDITSSTCDDQNCMVTTTEF